jgi:uncharacterized SAM-binding protein YcdF (DUF218 family)
VEGNSGDTYENVRFSTPMLRAASVHRIVLVTSSTHEWRAAHEFIAAGFEVIPAPVNSSSGRRVTVADYLPTPDGLVRSYSALYELLGEPVRELMSALHIRKQPAAG